MLIILFKKIFHKYLKKENYGELIEKEKKCIKCRKEIQFMNIGILMEQVMKL